MLGKSGLNTIGADILNAPGVFCGSDEFRGTGEFCGSDEFRGTGGGCDEFRGTGELRGCDEFGGIGGLRGTGEFGGTGGLCGDGEGSCLSLLGNGVGRFGCHLHFGATKDGTGRRWVEGGRSSVSSSGEYKLGRSSDSESLVGLYCGSTGL
ncbi:hypothetical protein TNIN_51421 [Trichonephila inaurata madagascariensis]|uniref:Uncharacterized protein n=1 Tax=Trichonephila inaurata madagascariensis TaxID=2747483 RepID=A0A8X6X6U8_9ARAC|nr:hypothetical protein TNIN_51421 [Trichonephila inaurata madagascariensis]